MTSSEEPPETGPHGVGRAPSAFKTGKLPTLSLGTRVITFIVGWSLLLVGVAGLALPGIQGVLTILIGAAVLSIASETVYRLLRRLFRRWPGGWKRVKGFRQRIHGWLHRGPKAAKPGEPGPLEPPDDGS